MHMAQHGSTADSSTVPWHSAALVAVGRVCTRIIYIYIYIMPRRIHAHTVADTAAPFQYEEAFPPALQCTTPPHTVSAPHRHTPSAYHTATAGNMPDRTSGAESHGKGRASVCGSAVTAREGRDMAVNTAVHVSHAQLHLRACLRTYVRPSTQT